jgi:hypothetical protein
MRSSALPEENGLPAGNQASVVAPVVLSIQSAEFSGQAVISSGQQAQSPERIPLEKISIEGEYFITVKAYDSVKDKEQTTRDWIRHQDGIYLNGFSLRTIVDNLKKEYIKELISEFLYSDKDPQIIAKRIAGLHELAHQFFGDLTGLQYITGENERNVPDSFAEKLACHLKEIIFDLDINIKKVKPIIDEVIKQEDGSEEAKANPDDVGLNIEDEKSSVDVGDQVHDGIAPPVEDIKVPVSQATPQRRYQFSHTPEMQLIRQWVQKFSYYFSTWRIEQSAKILEKILNDYLFYTLTSEEAKLKYIELFFKVGHHGGFMYSCFTAHLQHIDKTKYVIRSDACIDQARIYITSDDFNVYIQESTPIFCIYSLDEAVPDVENADKSNVMETHVKHVVSMTDKGEALLRIFSAEDYCYNLAARDILLGEWLRLKKMLSNYANHYIEAGHNLMMIHAILELCPSIKAFCAYKPAGFQRLFSNQAQSQGDKVLLYLGRNSPSYAESLLVNLDHYAEMDEEHFIRAVRLLQLMDRNDLAKKGLLPYLTREKRGTELVKVDNTVVAEKNIKAAYQYMIAIGFLSAPVTFANLNRSKSESDVITHKGRLAKVHQDHDDFASAVLIQSRKTF